MLFLLFAPPFYGQKKNVLLKIFFSNVEFYIKPSRRVSVSMHTGQEWLKQQQQNNGLSIKLLRHSNFLFSFFSGLMSFVVVVVTSLLLSVCMVVVVAAPFFFLFSTKIHFSFYCLRISPPTPFFTIETKKYKLSISSYKQIPWLSDWLTINPPGNPSILKKKMKTNAVSYPLYYTWMMTKTRS